MDNNFPRTALDRIDEGVVSRPSGTPARQVRMHYLDQILWQHPATETRMISTNPAKKLYLSIWILLKLISIPFLFDLG